MENRYKIVYFNGRGKAEVSRLLFHLVDQHFEDVRIERQDWPSYKPHMPFGQVPILEITNGSEVIVLAQSAAIGRFLANKFNLAGKTDLERARVDMVGVAMVWLVLLHLNFPFYKSDC